MIKKYRLKTKIGWDNDINYYIQRKRFIGWKTIKVFFFKDEALEYLNDILMNNGENNALNDK